MLFLTIVGRNISKLIYTFELSDFPLTGKNKYTFYPDSRVRGNASVPHKSAFFCFFGKRTFDSFNVSLEMNFITSGSEWPNRSLITKWQIFNVKHNHITIWRGLSKRSFDLSSGDPGYHTETYKVKCSWKEKLLP